MTFKHKLARRLAMLKERLVAIAPAAFAAAALFACEKPIPLGTTGGTITSLIVSPKTLTLHPNTTADFTAVAFMSSGDSAAVAISWSVTGGSMIDTTSSGQRHYGHYKAGSSLGQAKVVASSNPGGLSDTATVTVTPAPVATVTVAPPSATLAVGGTAQLTATTLDSAGNVLSGRTVTWASNNTAVATVSGSGLVTAAGAGSTTITATSEGQSGTASITVSSVPVASVTVTPVSASLQVGQTQQLTATAKDSAGNTLSGRVITWSSSDTTIAKVSGSGLVSARAAGSATITATSEGKSGTSAVSVTIAPVASVTVSPATASVQAGSGIQLTATPKDASGNTLTGRVVTWATSDASVATVSSSGRVSGVTPGSVTITATSEGKSGSSAITVTAAPPPGTHAGWYVATNGSSSGSGTTSSPWDLNTGLSGGNGAVQPGDTVWLRGGTYTGQFRSTLTGTAAAPIVVRQYPGERAIIDGAGSTNDTFVADGAYSIFWGFEVTNSDPVRCCSTSSFFRADAMVNHAPHTKFINMIIHDTGPGYYTWTQFADVEIYGAIIFNVGYDGSDRGHGHSMYLKNDVGPLLVRDNIVFNSYGYGFHCYTNTGDGLLNGIDLEGNTAFNSGTLSAQGTSGNLGNLGQPPANNMKMIDNMTYFSPGIGGSNWLLGSGDGLLATGNYVVGGTGMSEGTWTNATITGNTVITTGPTPTQPLVFVRPNAYEPGRASVIIYNWSRQATVSVDLSSVLSVGSRYEVRNVQDIFGPPVLSGTFGGTISFPMAGITPPTPIGLSSSPSPVTGPDFNVFIVTTVQ
ncbi:MAG TPA: Ig-like domain-containing protein [Gemmatimonadales bacterium]|nr:Ig-like domain-containing protein [Gemmatimonadales bacterium]